MARLKGQDISAFGYRRIVILLVSLIVVPTFLLLTIGVVLLFLGEAKVNLLMGILVLALSGAAATGVILVWVFVRREANLSRLQSDFVSKVSHELRTPLTSIRLFAETLGLRRGDEAANQKCLDGLQRETARLQGLIDRLLDWGQMESGNRKFTLVRLEPGDVIQTALDAFGPMQQHMGIELQVKIEPGLPRVLADREALSDALLNLLTNAAKYGGSPPAIELTARRQDNKVAIAVRDNGKGIHASEHSRIFQKFYRVDDRLAREQEGSGLGLAIVKHVVRAHGGTVTLESAPGRGSVFTMSVPLAERS